MQAVCFKDLKVLTQMRFECSSYVSEKTSVLIKCVPVFFRSYREGQSGLQHMKKNDTWSLWNRQAMKERNEEAELWEVRTVKHQKVKERVFFLPTELLARNRRVILSLWFKIIVALTPRHIDSKAFCVRSLSWVILNIYICILRCSP